MTNKVWFLIANPKTNANWNDTTDTKSWEKHEDYIPWGIPDGNMDLKNLQEVGIDDIILCYHAIDKEIIGCCRCKHEHYVNQEEEDGYSHRIDISKINNRNHIKLDELKQIGFKIIHDYLYNPLPRGRSVVHVPRDDWDKFKKIWAEYNRC